MSRVQYTTQAEEDILDLASTSPKTMWMQPTG